MEARNLPEKNDAKLRLGLTKDKQYLVALLPEKYGENTIDHDWVLTQIKRKGFEDLFPLNDHIEKLVKLFNTHTLSKRLIPIAERRDAQASLRIDPDGMAVYLTIQPAFGGETIDRKSIHKLLLSQKVVHGVDSRAIGQAVLLGTAEDLVIARGIPAIDGEDAKFISLLPEAKSRQPTIQEDGSVDFRDLGSIYTVKENEKLMRRIPATKGTQGYDVYGNPIAPVDGVEEIFSASLVGAHIVPGDPNMLFASYSGQPIIVENGVNVEKVISYDEVNLSSGNVVFDGTVIVNGDVAPGMVIDATGDIHVEGIVEASTLNADGDICVNGSIIGHGDIYDQLGRLKEEISIITSGGSISAKYAENIKLVSRDSIYIKEQSMRCEMDAKNEIIVGGKGSKAGHLVGGKAVSGIMIKASVIGSQAGIKTCVEISIDDKLHKKMEALNSEITELQLDLRRSDTYLLAQKNNPNMINAEMLKEANKKKRLLEKKLDLLIGEKDLVKTELKRIKNGKIVVEKAIHPSSTVRVGKQVKNINEPLTARVFRLIDDKLVST